MKNLHKGIITLLLAVIVALLVIGSGVYIYINKKTSNISAVNSSSETGDWETYVNTKYSFSIEYPASILKAPTLDESQKNYTRIVFANMSDLAPDFQKIGQIIQPSLEIDISDKAIYSDPGYSQSAYYYEVSLSSGHSGFLPKAGGVGVRNFLAGVKLDDGSFLSVTMDKRKIVTCEKDGPCAEALEDEATMKLFNQIISTLKFGK